MTYSINWPITVRSAVPFRSGNDYGPIRFANHRLEQRPWTDTARSKACDSRSWKDRWAAVLCGSAYFFIGGWWSCCVLCPFTLFRSMQARYFRKAYVFVRLGGRVVREPDVRSTGRGWESRLPRCRVQPWASCLHACASVTKQYSLEPYSGGDARRPAGEVTLGVAQSNGSLPPGLWLRSPAGWLPRTGISSGTYDLFRVWDYLYVFVSHNEDGMYTVYVSVW